MDLAGADLRGANLNGADLAGADLSDANLTDANLSGANLSGANLSFASFSEAYLGTANLSRANCYGAGFAYAELTGADLFGANLSGADLSSAWLPHANLSRANLSDADLSSALLIGANLSYANLTGADLERANLKGANLENVDLTQALNAPRNGPLREHYEIKAPTSPAFNKWFGESVVVGDDKKPVVVYHGTNSGGFTIFDPSELDAHHNAFYFTDDLAVAETYVNAKQPLKRPDPAAESNAPVGIYRLYIKLVNPMVIEGQGRGWDKLRDHRAPGLRKTYEFAKWAQANGYDGVIFKDIVDDGGRGGVRAAPATVYAVFDPKAIKSATANVGSYDPNDPDIRHNPGRSLRGRRPSRR